MDPSPTPPLHTHTIEISIKLGSTTQDFSKWECLMLTGTTRYLATKKDGLQSMDTISTRMANSSKKTVTANYSSTGGSPAPLVRTLWLR